MKGNDLKKDDVVVVTFRDNEEPRMEGSIALVDRTTIQIRPMVKGKSWDGTVHVIPWTSIRMLTF